MRNENTTLSEVASQSLIVTAVITFSQFSGFIARYLFKVILPPEEYGLFAFFVNMALFAVSLNGFSLQIPLISIISKNPDDKEKHILVMSQILTTTFILGTAIGIGFFIWTAIATSSSFLPLFYGIMIVVMASGQVVHCYPRGLDKIKPAVWAYFIIGSLRILLVLAIFFLPLSSISVDVVAVIYTLPSIGWWISYFRLQGVPKIQKPNLRFVSRIYIDGGIAYLPSLAFSIPQVVGIAILSVMNEFSEIGDFDIALIPYSLFSMVLSGLSFIILNKARKMGSIEGVIKKLLSMLFIPLFFLSLGLLIVAIAFEGYLISIVISIGLPITIYWPAVYLITLGFPFRILFVSLASYLQGNGIIRPVGLIGIISTIMILPLEVFLVWSFSVMGLVFVIILENLIIAISIVVYGYRLSNQKNEAETSNLHTL